jgi:multiple sugar transport system permease protein
VSSLPAMLLPFAWMLSTSFKTAGEVFLQPPRWIPRELHWQNYLEALTATNFGQMYLNTIIISVSATIGQVRSASLVGFDFARLRAPGRNFLHPVIYLTDQHKYTVSLGLALFRDYNGIQWHWLMAARLCRCCPA